MLSIIAIDDQSSQACYLDILHFVLFLQADLFLNDAWGYRMLTSKYVNYQVIINVGDIYKQQLLFCPGENI